MHVKPEFHVMILESFIHASIPTFMWPTSWLIHGELFKDHKWWETPLELARNMWLFHIMFVLHLLKITWKKIGHPQLPIPFEQCCIKDEWKLNTTKHWWMNDPNNLSNVSILYESTPSLKYMFFHDLWILCVLWLLCSFDYEGSNQLD